MENNQDTIPANRDGIWKLIRQLKTFTLTDLDQTIDMERSSIKTYLDALLKAGFLKAEFQDEVKDKIYHLAKDNGVRRPDITREGAKKPITGRQRMWMAMKVLKRFDYRDLALTAKVPSIEAKSYLQALLKANYVRVLKKGRSTTPNVYQFLARMDHGPYAPVVKKDKSIYDRNLQKTVWPDSLESEVA